MDPKQADWEINWIPRDGGRQPRVAPDPTLPNGKVVDFIHDPDLPSCVGKLPYVLWPERGIGLLLIKCRRCGVTAAVTTAGRPDDPTSLTQNCKEH